MEPLVKIPIPIRLIHWEGYTIGLGHVTDFTDVIAMPTKDRTQYYQHEGVRDDEGRYVYELLHPQMPVAMGVKHVRRSH